MICSSCSETVVCCSCDCYSDEHGHTVSDDCSRHRDAKVTSSPEGDRRREDREGRGKEGREQAEGCRRPQALFSSNPAPVLANARGGPDDALGLDPGVAMVRAGA